MKVETNDIFDLMGQYDVDADTEEKHKPKKKKKGKGDKKNKNKEVSKPMEPKEVFNRELENSRFEIARMMCTINGINPKTFFVKTKKGICSKPISTRTTSLNGNDFIFQSNLNWNSSSSYDIATMKFKLRFLTVILEEISNKLSKISKQRYRLSDDEKLGLFENGYFHIKATTNDIKNLISMMNKNYQYRNNLLMVIFDSSYGGPRVFNPKNPKSNNVHRPSKLNGQIFAGVEEVLFGLNPKNILTDKLLEDDIAMYDIFRLAYMLSTGDDNNHNLFSFNVLEGYKKNADLTYVIKALGDSIIKSHKNGKPIVYTAFHEAHPIINSNITGSYHNISIITGIEALGLVKFVINNEKVSRFIDSMLGIKGSFSLFR
jgi:hypothetical protein